MWRGTGQRGPGSLTRAWPAASLAAGPPQAARLPGPAGSPVGRCRAAQGLWAWAGASVSTAWPHGGAGPCGRGADQGGVAPHAPESSWGGPGAAIPPGTVACAVLVSSVPPPPGPGLPQPLSPVTGEWPCPAGGLGRVARGGSPGEGAVPWPLFTHQAAVGVAWAGRLWEGSVAAAVPESRGLRSSPWCPAQASHGEARAGAPSAPWSPAGAPCELRGREGSAPDPPVPRGLPPSSGSGQGLGVWPRACDSTRQAGLPEGCVRHNGATPWAPASGPSPPHLPRLPSGRGCRRDPGVGCPRVPSAHGRLPRRVLGRRCVGLGSGSG